MTRGGVFSWLGLPLSRAPVGVEISRPRKCRRGSRRKKDSQGQGKEDSNKDPLHLSPSPVVCLHKPYRQLRRFLDPGPRTLRGGRSVRPRVFQAAILDQGLKFLLPDWEISVKLKSAQRRTESSQDL